VAWSTDRSHIECTIGRRNAFGQQGDYVIVKSWTRLGVACRHDLVDERIRDQPRNHVVVFRGVCRQTPSQVTGAPAHASSTLSAQASG
jgi:hypothetical protein